MSSGKELLREIKEAKVKDSAIAAWWLGQMGYIFKCGETILLVDGYLQPGKARLVPPAFDAGDGDIFDAVLGTHDHTDHIDGWAWPKLAKANPDTRFIASAAVKDEVCQRIGLDTARLVGMTEGDKVTVGDFTIECIPAAHESLEFDGEGRSRHLSFILNGRIFHAGDTCLYEGQRAKIRSFGRLDAMILPINGRDAYRFSHNCIGNMTFQEAVDLAGDMRPKVAIPGHYDMFAMNPGSPEAFRDYLKVKYPDVRCHIPAYNQRFDID